MKLNRINKTAAQEIELDSGVVFLVSYQTTVACFIPGQGFYKTQKHHSPTTSKHINQWLKKHDGFGREKTMPQEWFDNGLTIQTKIQTNMGA